HAQKLEATKNDPYLLGHFFDNELPLPYNALERYLDQPASDPGHLAAEKWLKARHAGSAEKSAITTADRQDFLEYFMDRYLGIISAAIKKHDPNHLLLGPRFYGPDFSSAPLFKAASRHLDVLSINYYDTWTPEMKMKFLTQWS